MLKQCDISREVFGTGENLLICGSVMALPPEIRALQGKVQCVCLDPPFMTGEKFMRRRPYGEKGWHTGNPAPRYPAYEDRFTSEKEYLRLVLTDQRLSPEISAFFDELFRSRGSVLMEKCSEYDPFRENADAPERSALEQKSIRELFGDFYTERSGGDGPAEEDLELLAYAEELSHHADVHGPALTDQIEKLLAFIARQEAKA